MKIKRWLLLLGFLILLPGVVQAGPWRWVMTLTARGTGTHILLPYHLYYDARVKRFYVVDAGNQELVSFSKTGDFLKVFSAGGELKVPVAMVKDARDNLWVVERGSNSLTYVDFKRRAVERHELTLPGGERVFPDRLEADSKGRLYLLDRLSGRVLLLDENLKVVREFFVPRERIVDFKVKRDGVWALGYLNGRVYRFSPQGKLLKVVDLKGTSLQFPVSIEIDSIGGIYVLDRHGGKVKVYDSSGNFRYAFLGPGKSRGRLYFPVQLVFDPEGRLCVVEEGNGRVEVFQR